MNDPSTPPAESWSKMESSGMSCGVSSFSYRCGILYVRIVFFRDYPNSLFCVVFSPPQHPPLRLHHTRRAIILAPHFFNMTFQRGVHPLSTISRRIHVGSLPFSGGQGTLRLHVCWSYPVSEVFSSFFFFFLFYNLKRLFFFFFVGLFVLRPEDSLSLVFFFPL